MVVLTCTINLCFGQNEKKKITIFHLKITFFAVLKNNNLKYGRVNKRWRKWVRVLERPCLSVLVLKSTDLGESIVLSDCTFNSNDRATEQKL